MARRPSFQFYSGDWLNDIALRAVSGEARGLWADMLCLMNQGDPYGHLTLNCAAMPPAVLARIYGESLERTNALLEELSSAGIYSRTDEGIIFSRRMVRDEKLRIERAEGGKLGGNPQLKKVRGKVRGKVRTKNDEGLSLPSRARGRSSSSSSSPSSSSSSASSSPASLEEGVPMEHSSAGADQSAEIQAVFGHYRKYHPKAHPKPSSKSKEWRKIANRLKEGYSVADLCRAIDGCHRSPWHCGENPDGTVYQNLELIVRDGSKVHRFIEFAEPGEAAPVLSQKDRRNQRAGESWLARSGTGEGEDLDAAQ